MIFFFYRLFFFQNKKIFLLVLPKFIPDFKSHFEIFKNHDSNIFEFV
jgi:hypothetical protein